MYKPLDRKLTVALCEMIKKNDKRKMTVSYLCRKAGIARATFYLHYKSFDEFIETAKKYIIRKLLKEAFFLLMCDDKELKNAVKKENLIFDEYDCIMLGYFTSNENCIEFGSKAFLNAEKFFSDSDIPKALAEKMLSGMHKGYEAFLPDIFVLCISVCPIMTKTVSEKRLKDAEFFLNCLFQDTIIRFSG